MSEIKLKRCPFCGRKAELRYSKNGFAYILCANDGCYARTDGCLNENGARRLWNTRKQIEEIVERLEEAKTIPFRMGYSNITLIDVDKVIEIVKEVGGMND